MLEKGELSIYGVIDGQPFVDGNCEIDTKINQKISIVKGLRPYNAQ